jgi:hypothetical protein
LENDAVCSVEEIENKQLQIENMLLIQKYVQYIVFTPCWCMPCLRFFTFCRLREQETLEQKLEKKRKKKKKNLKTSGSSAAEVAHEDFHPQANLVCRDQLPAVSFAADKAQPEFNGTEAPQQPPQPLSSHADGDCDFDEVVSTYRTRSAGGTETTNIMFKSDMMRFDRV